MKMTKTVCTVSTGALKRDITSSYESHNDGKRHFRVVFGPSVANCYGYPAYTAGCLWYEDQDGCVWYAVISAGSKMLPANKVTCSVVARKLGLPVVARYLARNYRGGDDAIKAARKAAFDELDAYYKGM
jgi:hypothetical protein